VVARGYTLGAAPLVRAVPGPPAAGRRRPANGASLVLRARSAALCLALPADATAEVERALAAEHGPCDVLKLGHHGSRTSSDPRWLDALAPRVAIASAGERRRSPLPHESVSRRLAQRGVRLVETRRSGAIEVRLDAPEPGLSGWAAPP
jgi:competence protein ComEC